MKIYILSNYINKYFLNYDKMSNKTNINCKKCLCCLNRDITDLNKEKTNLIKELTETKKLYKSTKNLLENVIRKDILSFFKIQKDYNVTFFNKIIQNITKYMLTI